MAKPMFAALKRARFGILTIALTYGAAVLAGIVMAQSSNRLALDFRDRIVSKASAGDLAFRAAVSGQRTRAALLDFGGNLFLGAVPQTFSGLGIVPPYAFAAFRGWVGGIVSVDSGHRSRLADPHERDYYLGVLLLQLLPFSLTGGAGVHLGLAWYRKWRESGYKVRWTLPLPRAAVVDTLWIYALAVPIFLIASLVEFLAR